jgi:hypothetical protein
MKTHYESTMDRIGPLRFKVRPFINEAFFKDVGNSYRRIAKILKIDKMPEALAEDYADAMFLEAYDYVFGDEWPIRHYPRHFSGEANNYNLLGRFFREAGDHIQPYLRFHMLAHERGGKRVYDVSDDLGLLLKETELRGLVTENLQLPFPAIYINVPASVDLRISTRKFVNQKLMGVYIVEQSDAVDCDLEEKANYREDGGLDIHPDYNGREKHRAWMMLFISEDVKKDVPDHAIFNHVLHLKPELPLDDVIQGSVADYQRAAAYGLIHKDMTEKWIGIFRFCLNTIVYATQSEPDPAVLENNPLAASLWQKTRAMPAHSKKRKALEAKAAASSEKRYVLGSSIVVDRSKMPATGASGTGQPLNVRVLVSGHWRRIAHGQGRTERRLTWIKPFWRGPELGAVAAPKKHKLVLSR